METAYYEPVSAPEDGGVYIIVANDSSDGLMALSSDCSAFTDGKRYYTINKGKVRYEGLPGKQLVFDKDGQVTVSDDMLWEITGSSSAWTIKTLNGEILSSTYKDNKDENSKGIALDKTNTFTNTTWIYSNKKLVSGGKYLTYDSTEKDAIGVAKSNLTVGGNLQADCFTMQFEGDDITFYKQVTKYDLDPANYTSITIDGTAIPYDGTPADMGDGLSVRMLPTGNEREYKFVITGIQPSELERVFQIQIVCAKTVNPMTINASMLGYINKAFTSGSASNGLTEAMTALVRYSQEIKALMARHSV